MPQCYTIREYEGFTRDGVGVPGLTPLPARAFDQLERRTADTASVVC